ncbi:VOC family protein [Nocardiopsis sediminis]|uniref:VOC family protein n=1 Tax=Nocardiopsis sediminis TaxID=1778267 RepID=A0ABV8FNM0_9ACTN
MRIARLSTALYVDDVAAGRDFLVGHFGFRPALDSEWVVKLVHDGTPCELILLPRAAHPDQARAEGVIIALEVADAAAEEARLRAAGVDITLPLLDEDWGERLFQVRDPNGVTVQLVQWLAPAPVTA